MIELVISHVLPAAFRVMGGSYDSREARAMLLAIGLQESRFLYRAQVRGPARGFWQFERSGASGVLTHPSSSAPALEAMAALKYAQAGESIRDTAVRMHAVLEHNDVLAAVFARLLLWTLPDPLPGKNSPNLAWGQYSSAWRPGAPRPETWAAFYAEAWERVDRQGAV